MRYNSLAVSIVTGTVNTPPILARETGHAILSIGQTVTAAAAMLLEFAPTEDGEFLPVLRQELDPTNLVPVSVNVGAFSVTTEQAHLFTIGGGFIRFRRVDDAGEDLAEEVDCPLTVTPYE